MEKTKLLAALKKNGSELCCSSEGLKRMVLAAVAQNGFALEYASNELKRFLSQL